MWRCGCQAGVLVGVADVCVDTWRVGGCGNVCVGLVLVDVEMCVSTWCWWMWRCACRLGVGRCGDVRVGTEVRVEVAVWWWAALMLVAATVLLLWEAHAGRIVLFVGCGALCFRETPSELVFHSLHCCPLGVMPMQLPPGGDAHAAALCKRSPRPHMTRTASSSNAEHVVGCASSGSASTARRCCFPGVLATCIPFFLLLAAASHCACPRCCPAAFQTFHTIHTLHTFHKIHKIHKHSTHVTRCKGPLSPS
jgi:hypothetical protein